MLIFITDAQGAASAFEQYAVKTTYELNELTLRDGEMWIEWRMGKLLAVFCGVFYDSDEWEDYTGEICFELPDLKLRCLEDVYNVGIENPSDINVLYYSKDYTIYLFMSIFCYIESLVGSFLLVKL